MNQRIESFLADVLALAGEEPDAVRGGGAARPRQVRGNLPAAGAEEAHEGPSSSRLPRIVLLSRRRGNASTPRNADRRALEAGAQHHRPAGALMSRTMFAVVVVLLNALGFASLAYVANRKGHHAMAALLAAGAWLFGVASVWLI